MANSEYVVLYRRNELDYPLETLTPVGGDGFDVSSPLGAAEPLEAWPTARPTPAMKPLLDGAGEPTADYVGVDERGEVVFFPAEQRGERRCLYVVAPSEARQRGLLHDLVSDLLVFDLIPGDQIKAVVDLEIRERGASPWDAIEEAGIFEAVDREVRVVHVAGPKEDIGYAITSALWRRVDINEDDTGDWGNDILSRAVDEIAEHGLRSNELDRRPVPCELRELD